MFFCSASSAKTGLNHFSFEVPDIRRRRHGHDYLEQFGKYEAHGGSAGTLGSQVYDYWATLRAACTSTGPTATTANLRQRQPSGGEEALTSQWGEAPPAVHRSPARDFACRHGGIRDFDQS